MKKILTIAFAALLVPAVMNAQVPNYSFENWTSMGTYDNPDGWATLNNTTTLASVYTVTKGTPGNPGTYYMKITSKTVGPGVVGGIAVSGKLDSMTVQPKSGFAFTQRPASFTGKWQHMIYGNSQGSVTATLTRWDSNSNTRIPVAVATQTLSGMAMSWANFSINFSYTDGGYPDTCIIVLKSSGANPTNNDYLWVDNLAFSGSVVGTGTEQSLLQQVSVFPNPAGSTMHVKMNLAKTQQVRIAICDLQGREVQSENATLQAGENTRTLDLSALARGTYLLRVVAEEGTAVQTIVAD
jgi:hypothetical protein